MDFIKYGAFQLLCSTICWNNFFLSMSTISYLFYHIKIPLYTNSHALYMICSPNSHIPCIKTHRLIFSKMARVFFFKLYGLSIVAVLFAKWWVMDKIAKALILFEMNRNRERPTGVTANKCTTYQFSVLLLLPLLFLPLPTFSPRSTFSPLSTFSPPSTFFLLSTFSPPSSPYSPSTFSPLSTFSLPSTFSPPSTFSSPSTFSP